MNIREERLDIGALDPDRDRSPGIHFSHILKPLLVAMDKQRYGRPFDPKVTLMGFVWEEVLSQGLSRLVEGSNPWIKQCELAEKIAGVNVTFTLDGFDWARWRVFESKATRISSRRPITDHIFWSWFVQMKAYCRAAKSTEAELLVLFLNGNYGRGEGEGGPEMKRWLVTFTDRELAENWMMLESKLADMLKKGEING